MARAARPVRLQVVVDSVLADQITRIAEAVDRTPSKIASNIIEQSLIARQSLSEKIALRIFGALGRAMGRKPTPTGSMVTLQVFVTEETFSKVEVLSATLCNTPARAAALLLDEGMQDAGWLVELFGPPVAKMDDFFNDLRKPKRAGKGSRAANQSPKAREYPCW